MAREIPPACLELMGISKSFQGRHVLSDVSLTVGEGEIVGIIGPNGAGKTTLFNLITGVVRADAGRVVFHGRDITGWPPHRICRAGIARAFQIPQPFPEMTVLENLLIGLWFGQEPGADARDARAEARELLALVGLGRKEAAPSHELNLMEKRRLEVARALATRPHLLLLDEIAAGLGPAAVWQTVELIKKLRDQRTLLITDHYLNLTLRVSDRLLALDQGEVIAEGPPAQVIRHPEVASAYLGRREVAASLEAGR
ncbi:MAG: ABC transporter ATP-binding protein [Desulfobacteraceae bacterium]